MPLKAGLQSLCLPVGKLLMGLSSTLANSSCHACVVLLTHLLHLELAWKCTSGLCRSATRRMALAAQASSASASLTTSTAQHLRSATAVTKGGGEDG